MPEININIKIIGGKRTDTKVYAVTKSQKKKIIAFNNGNKISENVFMEHIEKEVKRFIST